MSINQRAVSRVIIEGEWIWVERGTFTVVDYEFNDDDGNVVGRVKEPAYYFMSAQGDPYYGPLNKISLMKLDKQIMEDLADGPAPSRGQPMALGTGDDGEFEGDFAEDEAGSPAPPAEPADAESAAAAEQPKRPVPLFADDVPAEAEPAAEVAGGERRRGGLF